VCVCVCVCVCVILMAHFTTKMLILPPKFYILPTGFRWHDFYRQAHRRLLFVEKTFLDDLQTEKTHQTKNIYLFYNVGISIGEYDISQTKKTL
jgi:hypothetical protein